MDEYYRILELNPDASLADVKTAYRMMAKVWHPDRFANDLSLQLKAQERLCKINEAYERLSVHLAATKAATSENPAGPRRPKESSNSTNSGNGSQRGRPSNGEQAETESTRSAASGSKKQPREERNREAFARRESKRRDAAAKRLRAEIEKDRRNQLRKERKDAICKSSSKIITERVLLGCIAVAFASPVLFGAPPIVLMTGFPVLLTLYLIFIVCSEIFLIWID